MKSPGIRKWVQLIVVGLALGWGLRAIPAAAAPAGSPIYLPVAMNAAWPANELVFRSLGDSTDAELGSLNCTAWATCRSADYANYWLSGSSEATVESSYSASTGKFALKRVALFFDTSGLPDQAVIKSATLRVYSGAGQAGSNQVHVVRTTATTPPGPSSLGAFILVSGGNALVGPSQWVEIPLDPGALAWIHTAGFTRLGLVHALDLSGAAPTGLNYLRLGLWEMPGKEPELVVTYVVGGP